MSINHAVLALRLEGPMQSWGYDSQFNRRNTGLFPTKSALAGLCCAAMGLYRGSPGEKITLEKFTTLKLLCIVVPRCVKNKEIMVKRMQDYHTVQGTRDAKGKMKPDAVLTYRQYLNDSGFLALFEGERKFLEEISMALQNPVWGIWLGRKSCIPSVPIFAGLYLSSDEAAKKLLDGKSLESFTRVQEVDSFGEGIDSYMDQAVSFELYARKFAPRRVMLHEAKIVD
ncbi:MAG: type I-E CRISPR-associated protein Cas5/CasD [Planctomycetes bacterium]|nr:type I-E CRISPR-associated protein Cas5/CasD [Planctomycetota bacterium]